MRSRTRTSDSRQTDFDRFWDALEKGETWAQRAHLRTVEVLGHFVAGRCGVPTETGKDFAQEACLRVIERMTSGSALSFTTPSDFAEYLRKTATTACAEYLRQFFRRLPWEELWSSRFEDRTSEYFEKYPQVREHALEWVFSTAREACNDDHYHFFRLHYVEGLEPSEIATKMGVKRTTVRSALCRCRDRIRKKARKEGWVLPPGAWTASGR